MAQGDSVDVRIMLRASSWNVGGIVRQQMKQAKQMYLSLVHPLEEISHAVVGHDH